MAYLCGLLNSELLDVWYAVRGKRPRDVWRNYEPKPMRRIPYRHVNYQLERAPCDERLTTVREALAGGNADEAARAAEQIGAALTDDPSVDVAAAAALEHVVRAIAANRRAVLPHRALVPELRRIVKDPWRTGPVELDRRALVAALDPAEVVSARLDPVLDFTATGDGPVGRPGHQPGAISFTRGRQQTAGLTGPAERIELLLDLLPRDAKLLPSDVEGQLLPRDLDTFAERVSHERDAIQAMLDEGRTLVEAAERLVCRLYALPRELEEAVVAHAVARAAVSQPAIE